MATRKIAVTEFRFYKLRGCQIGTPVVSTITKRIAGHLCETEVARIVGADQHCRELREQGWQYDEKYTRRMELKQ